MPPLIRSLLWLAALAPAAGAAAARLNLPLPWMLGPLFAIAAARLAGLRIEMPAGGRQLGQWAVGILLGLHFSPETVVVLVQHALTIVTMALLSLFVAIGAAWLLWRCTRVSASTALYAALPGGASEMVVLAARQGAAVDLIAAAHVLRVCLIVALVPLALTQWAGAGQITEIAQSRGGGVGAWLVLLAGAVAGTLLFQLLPIANAWLLGPLTGVAVLAAQGTALPVPPAGFGNGGQLLLGAALGCRFAPGFFAHAPRFLGVSLLGTLAALAVTLLALLGLAALTGWPLPALLLAAVPGGMAEMSLTAAVLHWSVPLVIATHLLRVILLSSCGPLLLRAFMMLPGVGRAAA